MTNDSKPAAQILQQMKPPRHFTLKLCSGLCVLETKALWTYTILIEPHSPIKCIPTGEGRKLEICVNSSGNEGYAHGTSILIRLFVVW